MNSRSRDIFSQFQFEVRTEPHRRSQPNAIDAQYTIGSSRMQFQHVLLRIALLIVLVVSVSDRAFATSPSSSEAQSSCSSIMADAERLACYDQLPAMVHVTTPDPAEVDPTNWATVDGHSYLARLWELDEELRVHDLPIYVHNSNFVMPFTFNTRKNGASTEAADPGKHVDPVEVIGQISFKVKLWESILGYEADLWVAHTQQFFWQLYNDADSSYFRDTNYAPELFVNFRTDIPVLGFRMRYINLGVIHQSNGRSSPLSRSWDRIQANFGFERDNWVVTVNTWYRRPESSGDDDNSDISDFLGYGQLNLSYFWKRHRFDVSWRNNVNFHKNRGALQTSWSFPFYRRVNAYVEYFHGYGASLLEYNQLANRFGIGFVLNDWSKYK